MLHTQKLGRSKHFLSTVCPTPLTKDHLLYPELSLAADALHVCEKGIHVQGCLGVLVLLVLLIQLPHRGELLRECLRAPGHHG